MSQARKYIGRTREEIEELLNKLEACESTQAVFAKRHRLSVSTLQFWLARRRREASVKRSPSRFVPVSVAIAGEAAAATSLDLEFGADRRLRIPSDIDPEVLSRLLPVITRAC